MGMKEYSFPYIYRYTTSCIQISLSENLDKYLDALLKKTLSSLEEELSLDPDSDTRTKK
jgi:hypothetical protein